MSLRDSFRLVYGEGTGKKVEADFRLFRLGYEAGVKDSAISGRVKEKDNFEKYYKSQWAKQWAKEVDEKLYGRTKLEEIEK